MKKKTTSVLSFKFIAFCCLTLFLSFVSQAQTQDTLHVNYDNIKVTPHDTALAKMDAWIKSLNGAHVDINVYAYYSKIEFKKYAQQRADEMFLILNRKARSQFTIVFIGPKKGENSQRSRVDIVYTRPLTEAEKAAIAAKEAEAKAEEAKKAAEKEAEKAAKAAEKEKKSAGKAKGAEAGAAAGVAAGAAGAEKDKKSDKDKKSEKDKEEKGEGDDQDYGQASTRDFNDGYSISGEEVLYIKRAKLVVAQTGNKEVDANLFRAVKEFWNFSDNPTQMPYKDVIEAKKENKKDSVAIISFIQIKTWFPVKRGPVTIKLPYFGYAVAIETGRGKLLIKQFINKETGKAPTLLSFVSAISFMNDVCKIVDENKLKKSKVDKFYDERTAALKEKTLYLAQSQIHPNLPIEEIGSVYTSPFKIVSDKDFEKAILEKQDVAYVFVIETPNPQHTCFHYIMSAKTGQVYLFDYGAPVSFMPSGVKDATNSGLIDKPNFNRYEKGVNAAIADNNKRVESKTKDEDAAKAKAEKEAKKAEEKKKKDEAAAAEKEEKKKKKEEKEAAEKK